MKKQKEDLINWGLMMIVFAGAVAGGAILLAAGINQVFTYISARLATYTSHNRAPAGVSSRTILRITE